MKNFKHTGLLVILLMLLGLAVNGQISPNNPYCTVAYTSGQCNQPGPSNSANNGINDFINDFNTCGANHNIVNNNSGCNGLANNYIYYGTTHTLIVAPNQAITCNLRSGITYAQGFAIFVDWNQNNLFDLPSELMGNTPAFPAANTWTTITFTIPNAQPIGLYRMRVRCSFVTNNPPPCGTQMYGETEDYDLEVVAGNTSGILTATAAVNNATLCSGQTLSLTVVTSSSSAPPVTWTGPGFTSTLTNPTIPNVSPGNSGTYTVTVANGGCPVISTASVIVAPSANFSITPTTQSVCQGGFIYVNASTSSPTTQLSFLWSTTAPGTIFNPQLPGTTIQPGLLSSVTASAAFVYSLVVTPTLMSCPVVHTMTVSVFNPLTPTLTLTPPICDTHSPVQFTATPGGGIWSANTSVSAGGLLNPATAVTVNPNFVSYTYNSWTCTATNSGNFEVSKFHTAALSNTLNTFCVQDPQFNLMNIVQTTVTGSWSGPQVSGSQFFSPLGLATGSYNLTYNTYSQPNVTVCPASTVLVVTVFNPPTPTISFINPVCNTAGTIALTAWPANGVWSGNSGVSVSGVQTPSNNLIGANSVTYTAGQGTCVASTARSFTVSQFNTAALSGTIGNLCVTSSAINLMTIVQNTNGAWAGPGINNTTFSPVGLPTNTYQLVYSTTSTPIAGMCNDQKSIIVSVLNPPTPVITKVGPFCSNGGPVQLVVSPATGSWNPSVYLTSGGIFTPSLTPIGNNPVHYVVGTSTCNIQKSIVITTEAFVSAGISGTLPELCITSPPASLSQLTYNNLGTWYGTGVTGPSFNPGISGAGTFILSYHTASSPSGLCPDQGTVAVNVFSLATPVISNAGPFCNTSPPAQLTVTPVGGFFSSGNSPVVNLSGLFNPALGTVGMNLISYSVTIGPCLAYAQTSVTIEEFVSADFETGVKTAYCRNTQPFNLNSIVQHPGGVWSGPGVVGSLFDPARANSGDNNIVIYQTHSTPSALLCVDTSAVRITVKNVPKITATRSFEKGCAPAEVVFSLQETLTGKGVWTFGDGTTETSLVTKHVYQTPGTYSIQFNYSDETAEGCSAAFSFSKPIEVFEMPNAGFSVYPEEISIANPHAVLTNLSSQGYDNAYVWTIEGMNQQFELSPEIDFPQAGNYKITLLATSSNGCKHETSQIVEVKNDFNIYIPNSFSPNADDLNDVFRPVFSPYGLDAKTYRMEIYDRWGHQLFSTTDFRKGWDGTLQNKGESTLKQDSYIYTIRYKDIEGRIYDKTGAFFLLPNE